MFNRYSTLGNSIALIIRNLALPSNQESSNQFNRSMTQVITILSILILVYLFAILFIDNGDLITAILIIFLAIYIFGIFLIYKQFNNVKEKISERQNSLKLFNALRKNKVACNNMKDGHKDPIVVSDKYIYLKASNGEYLFSKEELQTMNESIESRIEKSEKTNLITSSFFTILLSIVALILDYKDKFDWTFLIIMIIFVIVISYAATVIRLYEYTIDFNTIETTMFAMNNQQIEKLIKDDDKS